MADVKKTVLTVFEADTTNYDKKLAQSTMATDKLLDSIIDKQQQIGEEAESNEKQFKSSFGSMADGIGKVIPGFDKVAGGFKKAEQASRQFGLSAKAALISTGIGALVVAIGSLISKFQELNNKSEEDLTFLESKFVSVGRSIQESVNKTLNKLGEWLTKNRELVAFLTFGASELAFKYAEESAAYEKSIEEKKKAQEEWDAALIKAKATAKAYEEELARQKETERLLAIENKNLAKTYRESLKEMTDADKERANERKRIADQELLDYLKRQEEKEKAVQKEIESTEISIELYEEEIERISEADEAEIRKTKRQVEGMKIVNDLMKGTAIYQKGVQIKQAILDARKAITAIWAQTGVRFVRKLAQSAIVAGITAKQIKEMSGVTFAQGGVVPGKSGGMIKGRRHYQGGVKFRIGGYAAEAEGGEFIVNRKATANFLPMLKAINETGLKKYQSGGVVDTGLGELNRLQSELVNAASQSRPVLVVEDYRRASGRLDVVESLAKI
jgi:hypothetical protein